MGCAGAQAPAAGLYHGPIGPRSIPSQHAQLQRRPLVVPCGTFWTVKVERSFAANLRSIASTQWWAAGIGRVQEEVPQRFGEPAVWELISTNREYVPEPGRVGLQMGVLAALTALANRRRVRARFARETR